MAAFLTADHGDSADGIFRLQGFEFVSDFELRISDFPLPCIPCVPWSIPPSLVGARPHWVFRGSPLSLGYPCCVFRGYPSYLPLISRKSFSASISIRSFDCR